MNEIQIDELDQSIVSKILALSSTEIDDRLDVLWNRHEQEQKVASELNRIGLFNANSVLSEADYRSELTLSAVLPMLYTYDRAEFSRLFKNKQVVTGTLVASLAYKPIMHGLIEDEVILKVREHSFSSEVDEIVILYKTKQRTLDYVMVEYQVFVKSKKVYLETDGFSDTENVVGGVVSLHVLEELVINIHFIQNIVKAVGSKFGSVSDENGLYESDLELTWNNECIIQVCRTNLNVNELKYEKASLVVNEHFLYEEVTDSPFPGGDLEIDSEFIEVAIACNLLDIIVLTKGMSNQVLRQMSDSSLRKYEQAVLVKSLATQCAWYAISVQAMLEEVSADTEVDELFSSVIKTQASLAELTSAVSRWGSETIETTEWRYAALKTRIGPLKAMRDTSTVTGSGYVTTHSSDIIAVNDESNFREITQVVNEVDNFQELVELQETDTLIIFARLSYGRGGRVGIGSSRKQTGMGRKLLGVSWLKDLFGFHNIDVGKGDVMGIANCVVTALEVTLHSIFVALKNTDAEPADEGSEISVVMWHGGKEQETVLRNGVSGILVDGSRYLRGMWYTADIISQLDGSQLGVNPDVEYFLNIDLLKEERISVMNDRTAMSEALMDKGLEVEFERNVDRMSLLTRFTYNSEFLSNWYGWARTELDDPSMRSYNTMAFRGTLVHEIFGATTPIESWRLAHTGVIIGVKVIVKVRVSRPPVYLGVLEYGNSFVYTVEIVLQEIFSSIDGIRADIKDMKEQIAWLEAEFLLFRKAQEPGKWDFVMNILMDVVLGIGLGVAGGALFAVTKMLASAAGKALRSVKVNLSRSSSRGLFSKSYKKDRLPIQSMTEFQSMTDMYLSSRKLKRSDVIKSDRPLPRKESTFDVTDNIDLTASMRSGGRYKSGDYPERFVNHGSINRNLSEHPLPSVEVFYRPLATLPRPLGDVIHNGITLSNRSRAKLQFELASDNSRKPSHAFTVIENYERLGDGKVRLTKLYSGVGELNTKGARTNDKGAGPGGVLVTYDSVYKDRSGLITYSLNDFQTSGYSEGQVISLYDTLYRRGPNKDLGAVLTVDEKWESIAHEVGRKIHTSDSLNKTYLPDRSKLDSLSNVLANPDVRQDWSYNMLFNNCQHWTQSIVNYVEGRGISNRWSLQMQEEVMKKRIRLYDSTLGSSPAMMKHKIIRKRKDDILREASSRVNGHTLHFMLDNPRND